MAEGGSGPDADDAGEEGDGDGGEEPGAPELSTAPRFRGVAFAAVQDDPAADSPAGRDPVTAPKPAAPADPAEADEPGVETPADPPAATLPSAAMRQEKGEADDEPVDPAPADPPAGENTESAEADAAMADATAATDAGDEGTADALPVPPAPDAEADDAEPDDADAPAEGEAAPPAPMRDAPTDDPPAGDGAAEVDAAAQEPPPEFFPLDESRRAAIRERLKRERVDAAVEEKVSAAAEVMYTLGSDVWAEVPVPEDPSVDLSEAELEELREQARQTIAGRLTEYAEENGLEYVSTEFVGVDDVAEDTYPVMLAETGFDTDDPFAQRDLLVARLFGSFTGPLYQVVRTGVRPDSGDGFAVWKTDQRYSAEQELTDPGVREAVVAAYKRRKAVELAQARAEALAAEASEEGKTLADVVAGQSLTGPLPPDASEAAPEEGEPEVPLALEVEPTGPFTRLRLNRPTGPFAQFSPPTPGPAGVPGVGAVSEEFLDAAFDDLSVGEAAAAEDADGAVVYVLELNDREPDGDQLEDLYEDFLRDAATNPGIYARVNDGAAYDSQRAFIDGLFEKYGVSGVERPAAPEPRR